MFIRSIILIIVVLPITFSCSDDEGLSPTEQLEADIQAIDEYLMTENINAETHESGIRYVVKEIGGGLSPSVSDDITVKYRGYFFSGETFDSNSEGFTFNLSRLIPAWQYMIPEMAVGGKMTIYSPSGYCYGSQGTSNIPPNTRRSTPHSLFLFLHWSQCVSKFFEFVIFLFSSICIQ